MKTIFKSAIRIILFLLILQTCFFNTLAATLPLAGDTLYTRAERTTSQQITVNNLAGTTSSTADYTVSDYNGLIQTIAQQYIQRDTFFTIKYITSLGEVQNNISNNNDQLWDDIYSCDIPGTTSDLDYLHYNLSRMNISWRYSGTYAICEFSQTYLTSAAQEQFVQASVSEILSKLDITEASVYGKIKAIHDYIVNNVAYDQTYSRYSAYEALYSHSSVCQGYALLFYRMLMEAGIPVRFISGEATSGASRESHAWNIVNIGPYWYNVDVTWDDSAKTTKYMLKNNSAFSDHFRDSEFSTSAFNIAYPMSPTNFELTQDVKLVRNISFTEAEGTVYAVGDEFRLSASVAPADATNKTLSWSSSDPSVASVDSVGVVRVIGAGTAVITVSANDGTGKTALYTVSAQLPQTPSAWSQDSITSLNARGVIPEALKSNYRDSITRAEFMALIANVYAYTKGPYTPLGSHPFTDISGNAYENDILLGYELGIIGGTGDNLFEPEHTLTREQCAKIVGSAVKAISDVEIFSNTALPFGDNLLIGRWALPFVGFTFDAGLMMGSDGNFNPQGLLTREQAMAIVERMLEKYGW